MMMYMQLHIKVALLINHRYETLDASHDKFVRSLTIKNIDVSYLIEQSTP